MNPAENHAEPSGLYIHVPFCVKKCPYCDFYSITDHNLKPEFIEKLLLEMRMVSDPSIVFDTIFIGGGTPSVLSTSTIGRVLEAANRNFRIQRDAEITLEVNPGTVTPADLKQYYLAGINRLNIGVQSFNNKNLHFLGRIHSEKETSLVVQWAGNEGYENIGLDLIYGIPGQTKESWLADLNRAVELEPEHLSCYMLTYESGTRMEKDLRSHVFKPLDEGLTGQLFEITIDFLDSCGYFQYEISNFARSSKGVSRHNYKYWTFAPYLGLGPSAHSFNDPVRRWNIGSVEQYIALVGEGRLPDCEEERLNRGQCIMESILVGFRRTEGIPIDAFNKRCSANFIEMFGEVISDLEEKDLLKLSPNRCVLTRKGMLFLDSIVSIFINQEIQNV